MTPQEYERLTVMLAALAERINRLEERAETGGPARLLTSLHDRSRSSPSDPAVGARPR